MSPRVAIIADDLTGAGDTAVQFSNAGWSAELQLHPGRTDAEVVAVTTDSRALDDAAAADRVRAATRAARDGGATLVYKKIDSTLRGPVRAEIDAVLAEMGADVVAIVCPAFPEVGRTLEDGTLLVHGVPVADTAAGNDPVTPVLNSHVPTLLDAPLVHVDTTAPAEAWAKELAQHGPVVVVDARSVADLDRIAQAVVALGDKALAVGSAGLAEPLARRWRDSEAPGTTLVVVTSLHDVARGQADALGASGVPRHQPTTAQIRDDAAWSAFCATVTDAARARTSATLLVTAPEPEGEPVAPELVASRLAQVTRDLIDTAGITGLVVTGGDGARAVIAAVDATGIALHGQVAPGVPLGTLVGGSAATLPVATKAGGFGDEDILIAAAEAVRTMRSYA